jgi:calcineurin-like phosphoesterase family protein
MSIFFTSDTHYHHKNIVKGTTTWTNTGGIHNAQNVRDFSTLEEHDQAIIDNINKTVKQNDILYHLGDWSFGGIKQIWELRRRVNCKNIHFILGNHDHHIERSSVLELSYEDYMKYGPNGESLYNIRLIKTDERRVGHINMKDLFNSVTHYHEITIHGHMIVLCHFAFRVFNKSHHGAWNLYGHSHGTLEHTPYGKSMDVGIDTHPEFRPYHFDEVKSIMDKRVTLLVDHHNETTN